MSREIEFRGKRKDNGEWVYGSYKESFRGRDESRKHWIIQSAGHNGGALLIYERAEVTPETVGQFTGLKDKNDNKIFEGDRVKFYEEYDGKILYSIGGFFFEEENGRHTPLQLLNPIYCEVIGNIHNKEVTK